MVDPSGRPLRLKFTVNKSQSLQSFPTESVSTEAWELAFIPFQIDHFSQQFPEAQVQNL